MNLDLRHPYAFVVPVTEVSRMRISKFLSFQKCLRYPKSTDNLTVNIKKIKKKKLSLTGSDQRSIEPSVLYLALYHLSIIAQK